MDAFAQPLYNTNTFMTKPTALGFGVNISGAKPAVCYSYQDII